MKSLMFVQDAVILIIELVGFLSNLPCILAMFINYHLCVCVCISNATTPIHIPFELLKKEREKSDIGEITIESKRSITNGQRPL